MFKCPKCEDVHFTLVDIITTGSTFKNCAIQCNSCQTVVLTTDYINIGDQMQKFENRLDEFDRKLNAVLNNQ